MEHVWQLSIGRKVNAHDHSGERLQALSQKKITEERWYPRISIEKQERFATSSSHMTRGEFSAGRGLLDVTHVRDSRRVFERRRWKTRRGRKNMRNCVCTTVKRKKDVGVMRFFCCTVQG